MDQNTKVKVRSSVGNITIIIPHLNFTRTWNRPDQTYDLTLGTLSDGMNLPGIRYMFEQGLLVVDSAQVLSELGLDDLIGKQFPKREVMEELLTKSFHYFKEAFDKMAYEQQRILGEIAMEKGVDSFDIADYIKTKTGKDVVQAHVLRKQMEEAEAAEQAGAAK